MKKYFGLLLFSLLTEIHSELADNAPTVETKLGTIIGTIKDVNVFGTQTNVERYFGIPYAEPPIGELRFRKPVPKKPFTTPFKATKHGNVCLQVALLPMGDASLSEDCLFLNVYVPAVRKQDLAVMVFIHGGGFITGSSDPVISDTLAAHGEVIIVTINYRLSLWGFLTTEDKHAPGNYGLWDQHEAIRWVHNNIEAFGGDPTKVTIFGESAGGVSVVIQSLFEGNEGLFQRAIAQSGSITAPLVAKKEVKKDAEKLGKLVGCEELNSDALVKCLRNVPGNTLNETLNDFNNGLMDFPSPFVLVVDGEFIKEDYNQLLNGDSEKSAKGRSFFSSIDFLSGVDVEEGCMMMTAFLGTPDLDNFEPNRTFYEETLIPKMVKFSIGGDAPVVINDLTAHEYTDWSDPDDMDKRRHKFAAMCADLLFTVTLAETIAQHERLANGRKGTYMYVVDVSPSSHLLPTPSWCTKATHGDELQYVFFEESLEVWKLLGREDYKPMEWERDVAKYMINMWTNFAKTGNPNKPRPVQMFWPSYTKDAQQYLHISRDMTSDSVRSHIFTRELNFWKKVVPAVKRAVDDLRKDDQSATVTKGSGYCEKDGGCEP